MQTALTRLFGIQHPLICAPMAFMTGGKLAAAVSEAGGLGLLGGGYGDEAQLRRELPLAAAGTQHPWGAGLITWSASRAALDLILEYQPAAVMLSFGDPRPFAPVIHGSGSRLICQVQSVADARLALEAGADVIVAQGSEAGGHGTRGPSTLALVPIIVDTVAPVPVVAAGGIADGRGLAAALMLGAAGALIGTRFCAAREAQIGEAARSRLLAAGTEDTVRTTVFDVVRGYDWPTPAAQHGDTRDAANESYSGRVLTNQFTEQWHGHESALRADLETQTLRYREAAREQNHDIVQVWAGQGVGLVNRTQDAADIVDEICTQAAGLLSTNRLIP